MTDPLAPSFEAASIMAKKHALFLDFDGTLAPLQDDPDTVALPDDGEQCLLRLADLLDGALVLISGRGIHDLASRSPLGLWRAGGHGGDICAPGEMPGPVTETAPALLVSAVHDIIELIDNVRVELKGKVLAVHYRQNSAAGPGILEQLESLIAHHTDYRLQHGKMVTELKPSGTDKGSALRGFMQHAPFAGRTPIMVGDDTTDEDAMLAAMDLGGFGIKVGAGKTCAQFRFADTVAVWDWLKGHLNEHT